MPLVPAESLGYASASIAEAQPPLVVPMTAPLITGLRAIVYVAVPGQPGRYEGREVLLGPRAGDYYLVREGLAEGEQVVVRGNLYVDSAVQILARRSMMSPSAGTPAEEPESGEQPAGAAPRGGASASESAGGAAAPGAPPAPLPAGARQALDRIYEAYLAMHRALSGDAMQDAVNAAPALAAAVGELDAAELPAPARQEWNLLLPGLRKSVDGVARAADIASARAAFEGISNALITVARHVGLGSRPRLLVYHCPMAFDNRGARWLQAAPGVENPYFGSAMFTCGVVSEVLPASGAGGAP